MDTISAIQWCKEHEAEATWFKINGRSYILLECQGRVAQSNSFEEAVEYLSWLIKK